MTGITLDRSEFMALMDAVEAEAVVGLDLARLAPENLDEHKALVEKGLKLLQERGALRVVDDVNVLNIDLLSMAVLVAKPEVAMVTTREVPGQGQQLFFHYLADDVVVEQTLPDANSHRWALVPDRTALAERVLGILPVQPAAPTTAYTFTIDQDAFAALKVAVDEGNADNARGVLAGSGLTGPAADAIIGTMSQPAFAGTVAVLRCQGGEIVDARNLLVVQGKEAALLARQATPGEPTLEVTACDEATLRSVVTNWVMEFTNQHN